MTRFGAAVFKVDERRPGADLPLMSVSQTRGVIRRTELTSRPARADSLDAYKVCRKNDIVFNKMSIRAGAMGVAPEDGLVTYHYEVMRPTAGTDPRFIVYLMKSAWFTKELILRERGIGAGDQVNVRTTEVPFRVMRAIDCPVPSPEVQRAIANYLDRETAQIDTLVEEHERLISLLRERRLATLTALIGEAPRLPLRRVISQLRQGWSPNCEPVPADGILDWGVLKAGCSNGGVFDPSQSKKLPPEESPRAEHAIVRGEIVMSRSNAKELVGAAAVIDSDYPRMLLSDLNYALRVAPSVCPTYLAKALNSPDVRAQIGLASKGTSPSMQKISQRDVLGLVVPVPPLDEQIHISRAIESKTGRIDQLMGEAARSIELLKERRAALITATIGAEVDEARVV